MRIDLLITELNLGGAERQLTQLALGLHRAGHRVRVISIGGLPEKSPANVLLAALVQAKVPVESLGCDHIGRLPWARHRLRRLLAHDPPEIVQSFLFHANVLASAAVRRGQSMVLVGGIRVAQDRRWRLVCERHALAKMQAIVCVSDAVYEFVCQKLAPVAQRAVTIPNAVDLERFASPQPIDWRRYGITIDPSAAGAGVMLSVGRLHEQKGIDWLMQIAPALLRENPNAALVLLGDGPMRAAVQQRIAQLPAGRAALIEPQPEIAGFLASSRLLLLTSRYEGMPNVVMEAMAAGLPVVSTAVHGIGQLLGPASEPLVVPFGDDRAIVAAATGLLNDSGLESQVIAENQVKIRDSFSISLAVQRYIQLYQRLLPAAQRQQD